MKQNIKLDKRESRMIIIVVLFLIGWAVVFMIFTSVQTGKRKVENIGNRTRRQGEQKGVLATSDEALHDKKGMLIAIDPGHGGNDPGKVSLDGVLEKDVNLSISKKLKTELESRGYEVVLLREDDYNLATEGATNKKSSDMKNRVSIINDSHADVLISVHQNSYTDETVRGPQVFYYEGTNGSKELAKEVQSFLNRIDVNNKRREKQGEEYYILSKTVCPGIIVECGFLSCPYETALLISEDYQKKIASAIADAIDTAN